MKQALRLTVRVMPQGGKDKLESLQVSPSGEMFLKLWVKAAPEAGKANIAANNFACVPLGRSTKCYVFVERP